MNQFVESIKRLYQDGKISKDKVVELWNCGKLSEEDKMYILNVL